jgi:hypothetical protein
METSFKIPCQLISLFAIKERESKFCPLLVFFSCHFRVCETDSSVEQRLATDWTTGRSRFDPRQRRKDFVSNLYAQTGSGAHPASCTMGTGSPFPGGKARPGRDADHSPHLVPRSRISRSYTSTPPRRLRGVLWVSFSFNFKVFFNYFSVRVVGTCMTFYQYCPGLITALLQSVAYFHEQPALSPRQKTTITQSDTNVKTPTVGNGDEAQRTSFTFLLQMISPQTSSSAVIEL